MKTYTPFYKQIDIKPSRYEGRNGVMNLTGVSVTSVNIGTGIRLNPVNSKGVADNTWLDIPKEDVPALIALLQESIGQTPAQADNGSRTYVVMTSTDECLDTQILKTDRDLSDFTGRHSEMSIEAEEVAFEEGLKEILHGLGMSYDIGYSILDFIAISEIQSTPAPASN